MSKKITILDMTYIAMSTVIITICSWISIPTAVPFTLQTFGVFLVVAVLGGKRGTLAVLVYLLLAAIGIPVLAEFTGGLGIMLGMTGGYIFGFIFSALVMWLMERLLGRKRWVLAVSMVLGLLVCYAFGTVWYIFYFANTPDAVGLWTALVWCVFPYVIPDIVKIVCALLIYKKLAVILKIEGKQS
ncbi:MAG: biotin transporter BioY [Eubacterium sp.]|nr:biotin transporter BioY [Eubacterium sp.]